MVFSSKKGGDPLDVSERGGSRSGTNTGSSFTSSNTADANSSAAQSHSYNAVNGRTRRGRGELADSGRLNSNSSSNLTGHDRRRRPGGEPARSRGGAGQSSSNDPRRSHQSRGGGSAYDGAEGSERSLGISINDGSAIGDGGVANSETSSVHRQERRGSGTAGPRVVHRVGMECLSPINVSKTDGTTTSGEWVEITFEKC